DLGPDQTWLGGLVGRGEADERGLPFAVVQKRRVEGDWIAPVREPTLAGDAHLHGVPTVRGQRLERPVDQYGLRSVETGDLFAVEPNLGRALLPVRLIAGGGPGQARRGGRGEGAVSAALDTDGTDSGGAHRCVLSLSALDRAGGHTGDDLAVEEDVHDQRWDGDQQDVGEQQVPLVHRLAHEVVQGQLNSGVVLSG